MRAVSFAFILILILSGCSQSGGSNAAATPGASGDWPNSGYTLDGNRYVTSTITADNVAQLAPAWTTQIADTGEQEAAPIIVGGTMYVSTPHNSVLALDPATGALKWDASYTPSAVLDFAVNRGVSIANGKVFIATQDCHVRALDATTGKQLWSTVGCSLQANNWYSMATYVYNKMLLVGVAGGDFGGNGSVQAFSVDDGKKLWQWDTIPGPGQPGHETWPGNSWKHGGAALWGGLAVDPATNTLYIAPGNPAPDFYNGNRKGKNLYADSVVALDISGAQPKLKWYYQITDTDVHDADPAMPPVLFDSSANGQPQALLAEGDKGGNFVILDRTSGKVLQRLAVAHQAGLNEEPTPQGKEACPNHGGGVEWNGGAYDPTTNYFIVPVTQECGIFFVYAVQPPWQQGQNYHGGPMAKRQDGTGLVNAVDVATGKIAWQTPLPYPAQGGATLTSTGLTFTSDLAGNLYALDTKTGKQLWTYATHTAIVAPFSLYTVGGQEYLVVVGGEPGNQKTPNVPVSNGDYVMAFRVGATSPTANGIYWAERYDGCCSSRRQTNRNGTVHGRTSASWESRVHAKLFRLSRRAVARHFRSGAGRRGLCRNEAQYLGSAWDRYETDAAYRAGLAESDNVRGDHGVLACQQLREAGESGRVVPDIGSARVQDGGDCRADLFAKRFGVSM